MAEIDDLDAAIAALERQRDELGSAVVDAALRPLRQRRNELDAASRSEAIKLVTVVFSDLVGFTALSEKADPEEIRELTAGYFETWTRAIEAHGGVVEKFIGDAVLSVFGLPASREDDAERAVRAAWEVVARSNEAGLMMRVGVNTGRALASTLDERRGDFVVVGDVVNTASRLQSAAPPGRILLSEATWRLVRNAFVATPQPPLEVKGKQEPLRTFVVGGPMPRRFALAGIRREAPLVGRDAEHGRLLAALDDVAGGAAGVRTIVVSGEAGIGKSRLLAELDADLERDERRFVFFRARATPSTAASAGALLRDLIGSRFDVAADDPAERVLERIDAGIAEVVDLPSADAAAVPVVLGLRRPEGNADAEAVRFAGVRALTNLLATLAAQAPVVMLLEDLHWADASSLDVLEATLDGLASAPVLVVATTRPESVEAASAWPASGRREVLELGPLGGDDIDAVVRRVSMSDVPAHVVDAVVAAADGNPFYAEELARVLDESAGRDPDWRAVLERVPTTLAGVLQARLDALDVDARQVLQCGSIVGRVFWAAPLERMGVRALEDSLVLLAGRDLVHEQRPSTFAATAEHAFKHALLRDVTYGTLLGRQRRRDHAITASWLAETAAAAGREDDYAAVIASHHELAGERSAAAAWYRRAGDAAAAQFANAEALTSYEAADRLLPEGEADLARARFDVLLQIARLHDLAARRTEQAAVLMRASVASDGLEAADRATVLLRRSSLARATGAFGEAAELATSALAAVGDGASDDLAAAEVAVEAERDLGVVLWQSSSLAAAEAHLATAVEGARSLGLTRLEADATRRLGLVADSHADYERSVGLLRRALELAEDAGDPRLQANCHNSLGVGLMNAGDFGAAEPHLREAKRLREQIGDFAGVSASRHNLAVLLFERGDLVRSASEFAAEVEVCRAVGDVDGESAALLGLGSSAALLGDAEGGRSRLDEACVLLERLGDDAGLAEALTYLGMLDRVQGDLASARRRLERAEGLVRVEGFERDQAFALGELARVELDAGRPAVALDVARRAATLARDDADCAVLADAALSLALSRSGDGVSAVDVADRLLARLAAETTTGPRAFAWWAAATVRADAGNDGRAAAVARQGRDELLVRAARFEPDERRRYLESVPDHAALVRLAG